MQKLIVVIGATGVQGGSVAMTLLSGSDSTQGKYRVRIISRNPSQEKALELARLGAEVVQADYRDRTTIKAAFQGAYGVFAMTDYWSQGVTAWGESDETKVGIMLAEEAFASGVQHFVWSTLPSANQVSKGRYDKIEHWETKAGVTRYIRENLPGLATTSIYLGAYFDLFNTPVFMAKKDDNTRTATLTLPLSQSSSFAMVWAGKDTGPIVTRIFENPADTVGKTYALFRLVSITEAITVCEHNANMKIDFFQSSREQFLEAMGNGVMAHDILGNLEYLAEYRGFGGDEITPSGDGLLLGYTLSRFEEWVQSNFQQGKDDGPRFQMPVDN